MSSSLRPTPTPQCLVCMRRILDRGVQAWRPFQQQVRGSKKNAKPRTSITVRLLEDVDTFGRRGAIVPVPVGRMRNQFYPRRIAEYVTAAQLKPLKRSNASIERDFDFTTQRPKPESSKAQEVTKDEPLLGPPEVTAAPTPSLGLDLLSPQRSMELLEILLPPRIDFYRRPQPPQPEPKKPQQRSASSAADVLAAASAPPPKPQRTSIYGSVTTADIAASMRASLANNDEAARVIVIDEDIRFVSGNDESEMDRVKHLGDYNIEVKIRGAEQVVRRVVRVLAEEED